MELVKSVKEINVEDYVRNMTTALNQTFTPMGIELEQKPENRLETRISDWFENSLARDYPHDAALNVSSQKGDDGKTFLDCGERVK